MTWTDELIAKLIELVRSKLKASEIGKEMGISRNAVIGKVHRLSQKDPSLLLAGSPLRPTSTRKLPGKYVYKRLAKGKPMSEGEEPVVHRKRGRHVLVVKPEVPPLVPAVTWSAPKLGKNQVVTMLNREHWMCKWPIGHDKKGLITFCGKPRKDWKQGSNDETCSPYCEEHYVKSYQPTRASASPRPRPHYAK